uniref:F-box domain-containing protein n=1 Tax=Bionectria ochroleuca TaxID=29856 RepID=A0A8H7K208_BIOOC
MAMIKDLPTEVLLHILSFLHILTIERVAKTFTHTFTDVCLPILEPVLQKRREKARFIARFGMISNISTDDAVNYLNTSKTRLPLQISLKAVVRSQPEIADALDTLVLRGDLSWLKPLNPEMTSRMNRVFEHSPPTEDWDSTYNDLLKAAELVGITIPPIFLKFIRDPGLVKRIWTYSHANRMGFRLQEPLLVEDRGAISFPSTTTTVNRGHRQGCTLSQGRTGTIVCSLSLSRMHPEAALSMAQNVRSQRHASIPTTNAGWKKRILKLSCLTCTIPNCCAKYVSVEEIRMRLNRLRN